MGEARFGAQGTCTTPGKLGVARRVVADEDVAWDVVQGVLLAGTVVAALEALIRRRAGRSRP